MRIRDLIERKVKGELMCPDACCGAPVMECSCGPECAHCNCHEIQRLSKTNETATAGATSAGNIATVANPVHAHGQIPRDKNGIPKKKSKKNADGTVVNALDANDSFFGGKIAKR